MESFKNIFLNFIKNRSLSVVFFLLSIILPIIWLSGGMIYKPEESVFANYQGIYEKNLYSWNDKINYGEPAAQWDHTVLIPNAFFYKLLSLIGLSNHFIQIIFLEAVIFFILLSIKLFLELFTRDKIILLTGSLFYLFNFYLIASITYSAKMYQLILMPLFFLFVYRYLETKKNKYAIYNFLVFFIFQAIFTNLPQVIVTFFVYFIAIGYFIFIKRLRLIFFIKSYWRQLSLFAILIFPLLLYHAMVYYFASLYGQSISDSIKNQSSFKALTSPLYLVYQLRGVWWENQGYDGVMYNLWYNFYNNYFNIISSFILLIFSLVVHIKYKTRESLFFLVLLIFSLSLASGFVFAPEIYEWMYKNIPFFNMFREPWAKFIPLVIFSLTVSLVLSLKVLQRKVICFFILSLIISRIIPFISIDFFDRENLKWKKIFIKPPEHWRQYESWSRENKDAYVLPLPYLTDLYYQWYQTNYGNAYGVMSDLFGYTNIIGLPSHYSQLNQAGKLFESFSANKRDIDMLKIFPVDYLLEQKDVNTSLLKEDYSNQEKIKKYFFNQPFLSFNDKIKLYEIRSEYKLPKIYIPENIGLAKDVGQLLKMISLPDYNVHSAIYNSKEFNVRFNNLINEKIIDFTDESGAVSDRDKIFINQNKLSEFNLYNKVDLSKIEINIIYSKDNHEIIFSIMPDSGVAINNIIYNHEQFVLDRIDAGSWDAIKIEDQYIVLDRSFNKNIKLSKLIGNLEFYKISNRHINLDNNSFEQGLWMNMPGDCTRDMIGKENISTVLSDDSIDGVHSLELTSLNHHACVVKSFKIKLDRNKLYKYSFYGKGVVGGLSKYDYVLRFADGSAQTSGSPVFDVDKIWRAYTVFIKPQKDSEDLDFLFYAPSDGSSKIQNRFDDLQLEELELGQSYAYNFSNNFNDVSLTATDINLRDGVNELINDDLPSNQSEYFLIARSSDKKDVSVVNFKKINPTKYRISINNKTSSDLPLVFNESFHLGWKIYLANHHFFSNHFYETWFKDPIVGEENHFMVNGYANSWIVDTEEICKSDNYCVKNSDGTYNFELVVEYWPQRFFYAIQVVLVVMMIFCLGYTGRMFYILKIKNKNNNL